MSQRGRFETSMAVFWVSGAKLPALCDILFAIYGFPFQKFALLPAFPFSSSRSLKPPDDVDQNRIHLTTALVSD
eukprot:scaffold10262_cov189-Ochromonas_danica.AAC.1